MTDWVKNETKQVAPHQKVLLKPPKCHYRKVCWAIPIENDDSYNSGPELLQNIYSQLISPEILRSLVIEKWIVKAWEFY